jgi:hypothetical protein
MDDISETSSMNGEDGNVYNTLIGKPQVKRKLGRPECR